MTARIKKRQSSKRSGESGFAVLYAIGFALILGYITHSAFAIISEAQDSERRRSLKAEYTGMVGSVRAQLLNPLNCTRLLRGQPISRVKASSTHNPSAQNTSSGLTDISIPINFARKTEPLRAGWQATAVGAEKFPISLKYVRLATLSDRLPRQIRFDLPGGALYDKYLVRLYLVPNEMNINFRAVKTIDSNGSVVDRENSHYYIDLYVKTLAGQDQISFCHGTQSDAELCEAAGGAYYAEPNEDPNYRCHPDTRCWASSAGLSTTPNGCKTNHRFDTIQWIGSVDGTKRYLCSWCNQNL